jgi:predicted nucleic acid-binding protein
MSAAKAFVDTNVFVYIYSGTEQDKRKQAVARINPEHHDLALRLYWPQTPRFWRNR